MTQDEIAAANLLDACTFLPGSWNKRFARSIKTMAAIEPDKQLTERQHITLFRLFWMHRKQIKAMQGIVGNKHLLEYGEQVYNQEKLRKEQKRERAKSKLPIND